MLNLLLRSLYYCLLILSIVIIFSLLSSKLTGEDPSLFGYEAKQVLSGSMEPVIPTGSIAIMKKSYNLEELKEGDIITYTKEDHSVTHRIVNVSIPDGKMSFGTQGGKESIPGQGSSPATANHRAPHRHSHPESRHAPKLYKHEGRNNLLHPLSGADLPAICRYHL